MSLAIVFPGQGSQRVGMGSDWVTHPAAQAVFDEADTALGFDLSKLCFNGPAEELKLTANQQPALLTVSYATWQIVKNMLPRPAYFAGHSLGEYTALVAAGAVPFFDAVQTVHERGKLMQEAVPEGEGAMAAVIGLDPEKITEINNEIASELNLPLENANFNNPQQTVVSGAAKAVAAGIERYQEAGAKRVVELEVSAPFHSSLMVPAADGLKPRLEANNWSPAEVPVVANLTVQPYPEDVSQFPLMLHAQIFNPVRWVETVRFFAANGVTHLLEVGPGKVLRMLTPKIASDVKAFNIDQESERDNLKKWIEENLESQPGDHA